MLKPPERRFSYKAHAVALAATFTKPRAEFLEAQASCSLPATGGIASSRVEDFRFRDLISFRAAYSHATGVHNPETGAYNTLVTSVIEGFNIMGVVTADRIVARLASKHFIAPPKGSKSQEVPEPSILTLGSHFENLQVAGCPVICRPNKDILADCDTYTKAVEACKGRGKGATISTTIFSKLECDLTPVGHRIDFKEFGSIFLGEIQIDAAERRLTMIRFDLGCSFSGSGSAGDVGGNGSPVPPIG